VGGPDVRFWHKADIDPALRSPWIGCGCASCFLFPPCFPSHFRGNNSIKKTAWLLRFLHAQRSLFVKLQSGHPDLADGLPGTARAAVPGTKFTARASAQ
jgi:hypothetical protein